MCFCDCEPIATICKRRVRTAHLISETNKQYQTVTEARQLVRSAHPTKSISVHCAPDLSLYRSKRRVRTAHLISETNKQYQTVTEARQLVRSAHPTKSISVHCAPYLGNKQTLGGHNVRSKQ